MDYANAMIQHFFGNETWETREALLHEWMASGQFPQKLDAQCSEECVDILGEENQKDFVDDRSGDEGYPHVADAVVDDADQGGKVKRRSKKDSIVRRPQENYTLSSIKDLVPGK